MVITILLGPILCGAAAPPPANTQCPVMMDEPIDKAFSTEYKGKTVYLCCKSCLASFKKTPEKYLAALPQFKGATTAPASGKTSEEEHHHADDGGAAHGASRLIRFAGNFHPMAIHFPIALTIAAALGELLALVTKKSLYRDAARFTIILGAIGAAAGIATGWAAGAFAKHPAGLLATHRWLGTGAGALLVVTAVLSEVLHRRGNFAAGVGYRIALALAVVLIGLAGYFGGHLVYGPDHYSW
jgi:uncharacterized membrane protein/YHS domain-containing protein